jgi:hypothetical protein
MRPIRDRLRVPIGGYGVVPLSRAVGILLLALHQERTRDVAHRLRRNLLLQGANATAMRRKPRWSPRNVSYAGLHARPM